LEQSPTDGWTPQNTDHWDGESTIVVDARFGDAGLTGLADFSHVYMA
jgi:hypothetical protein